MTGAALTTVWGLSLAVCLLGLAVCIEAGLANLVMAVRTFKAMFDEPGDQGA